MQSVEERFERRILQIRLKAVMAATVIAGLALMIAVGSDLQAQSGDGTQAAIQASRGASQLAGPYQTWIDKDVHWIISPEERSAYLRLSSNAERLQFIEEFWQRRNPDPASRENRFKEEHYRRLAYANAHFAHAQPGWMTDRGRIYVVYGKPDSIDAYPSGGSGESMPFQVWHYGAIQGNSGDNAQAPTVHGADFEFVDTCGCGDYKLENLPAQLPR